MTFNVEPFWRDVQVTPQSVMPVCKQLHLVAHANTASVVFQKPHLLLGKQKTKVTEVRIPLAEEYSMADVWCVVPAGWCRWPQRLHSAALNTVTATGHAQWGAQCPAHSWPLSPTTRSLSMIDRDGKLGGEEKTSVHTENKACEYKHLVIIRAKSYNWGYAACDFCSKT